MQLTGNEFLLVNTGSLTQKMQIKDLATVNDSGDYLIPKELGNLNDVEVGGVTENQALVYKGGKWVPGDAVGSFVSLKGSSTISEADDGTKAQLSLMDTAAGTTAVQLNGEIGVNSMFNNPIVYGANVGLNKTDFDALGNARLIPNIQYILDTKLGDLADVTGGASPADDGKFLKFTGAAYTLEDLTGTDIGLPDGGADGEFLEWDNTDGEWKAKALRIAGESTDANALPGGVIIGPGLDIDGNGILTAEISGALILRGTCSLIADWDDSSNTGVKEREDNGDLATGDVFVNKEPNAAGAVTDIAWEQLGGTYIPAAAGGELVAYYDNTGSIGGKRGWLVVGNASTVILNDYIKNDGSVSMEAPLNFDDIVGGTGTNTTIGPVASVINNVLHVDEVSGIELGVSDATHGITVNPDGSSVIVGEDAVLKYIHVVDPADDPKLVVNKAYVDGELTGFVKREGDNVYGDLLFSASIDGATNSGIQPADGTFYASRIVAGNNVFGSLADGKSHILTDLVIGVGGCTDTLEVNSLSTFKCDSVFQDAEY